MNAGHIHLWLAAALAASSPASAAAGATCLSPTALAASPDGRTLYVCNRFNNDVAFLDLASDRTTRRVSVPREPVAAAVTPDGRFLLVADHLHAGRANLDCVAASVSMIDTALGRICEHILPPNGSGLLRDVKIAPDGWHAVVTHQLARFHLPTTQVERGWVNASAASFIDLGGLLLINTVLFDNSADDRHGNTSKLTPAQIDELAAFVLSL